MKLNNKGFAITGFLYSIFAIFLVILSMLIISMTSSKLTLDKVKKNVSIKLYDSYLDNYKVDTRYDLLKKINETINIDPNSKKYNIN